MWRHVLLALLGCLTAFPSLARQAQQVRAYSTHDTPPTPTRPGEAGPELDGTGWFLAHPRAAAPAAGAKGTAHLACDLPQLDEVCDFNTVSPFRPNWQLESFTLKAQSDRFHLWVETEALNNGGVAAPDIEALAGAIGAQTPSGSINPDAGILDNVEFIFGDPPDYDGDGILDILWFDIPDDFASTGRFFPGFIHTSDTDPEAEPGEGNQANIIYLDLNPLLTHADFGITDVKETIAEVYTDLLHLTYDADETTFVRIGVREWAKTLNGYPGTDATYLQEPIEHNLPLLLWDGFPGDRQRASLFTNYLAEQLGPEAIGTLVHEAANGADGFLALIDAEGDGRSLSEVILDFHTANYVNTPLIDPHLGYTTPSRRTVRAAPTFSIDASLFASLTPTTLDLDPGAVTYLSWDNVAGLQFSLDAATAAGREPVDIRIVTDHADGHRTITPLEPSAQPHDLSEPARVITAVISHTDLTADAVSVQMSATWTGTATAVENVAYDDGELESEKRYVPLGQEWKQAVRFEVPDGFALHRVYLAPFFLNQFNSDPPLPTTDPRDLTLHIWEDDGNGMPGEELLSFTVEDPRDFEYVNDLFIDPFPVDLYGYPEMAQLPATIHVGLSEAGTDDNSLVMAMAPYDVESTSSIYGPLGAGGAPGWFDLWKLTNQGILLEHRTIPIRVQFRVPPVDTGTEGEAVLPTAFVLHQNYPNPFNPQTLIPYTLSVAAPVRLAVYDVLGREVAVLVEALQPAGTYAVPFDAAGLGAGTYFYRLETPSYRLTRPMLLSK